MMNQARTCLSLLLLAVAAARAGQPVLEQQHLFTAGNGGWYGYRIPSVIATPKGTVLAFLEGRKDSFNDVGNVDTLLVRSFDAGRTWTRPQVIADHGPDFIGNPCAVFDRDTGTILLMLTGNRGDLARAEWAAGTGWHTVWIMRSTDEGATWSAPVEITGSIRGKHKDMTFYAAGPGNAIQLRTGRLIFPNYFRWKGTDQTSYANIIYSDDHGKSWTHAAPAGPKTGEAQAVELADGSVMLNMRSYHGRNRRAVSYSRDGGNTWTEPAPDEALIEPVCQGSIVRFTPAGRRSKNRLLFSNPASTRRENLTVRLSYDEGRTWAVSRSLHAGPSGYSSLVALPGGMVGCFYENGERDYRERLTFARFNLEWLTGGADSL